MGISSTPMINAELLGLPSIDRSSTAENLPTNQGDLFACVCTSMELKQNCLQRAFRIANNGNTSFGILEQVTTAIQLPSNHSRHQRLAVLYPLRTFMVRWASPIALHFDIHSSQ